MNKIWQRRLGMIGCVFVVLGWLCVTSSARADKLSDLLAGGTIQSDDKLFSDFEYVLNSGTVQATAIDVDPFMDLDGNPGIRISGSFSDNPGGGILDATLQYVITVLGPTQSIVSAKLVGNPSLSGNPNGFVNVTESFFGLPNLIEIFAGPGGSQLFDSTEFGDPQTQILVQKHITADAGNDLRTNPVRVSVIDQVFEQVPEPASIILSMIGAMGAVLFVRRFRRNA